jgi:aspartate-semialdehyde dehydrogenase
MALKPLDNATPIKRVIVSTYQSTSGAGRAAMDELHDQTKGKYLYKESEGSIFERQIAFNVIPKIGDFEADGYSDEETKIAQEVAKIMGDHVKLTATCVRVPVFLGHAISINVEFDGEMTAQEAQEILAESDGVTIQDYLTPVEVAGEDSVFISRIRDDHTQQNTINMWVVCDNLRKGAALNSVQIAEVNVTVTSIAEISANDKLLIN